MLALSRSRVGRSCRVTDQHRQALLSSSADYAKAKLAYANAIVIAQRAGIDEQRALSNETVMTPFAFIVAWALSWKLILELAPRRLDEARTLSSARRSDRGPGCAP